MSVLITGGSGFIGSHLCDAFLAKNKEVLVLDNFSTGSEKNIAHIKNDIQVIHGDIRDSDLVAKAVKRSDLVIHMAAAVGVDTILAKPIEAISTNFIGSEVVLNAVLKFNKKILIASTSEIYGKNSKHKLSETDDRIIGSPQKLRWSYSDAKALEEAVAFSLFLRKNLDVVTVRLFNTVGPRQTGEYGMVIPRFINAAIKGDPINVYGDGNQIRAFCHVLDTVQAIISLSTNSDCIGEVFNVGSEEETTILGLASKIKNYLNSNSTINFIDYKNAYEIGFEDMLRRVPDITKIKKFVNWSPTRDLKTIINDVWTYLN